MWTLLPCRDEASAGQREAERELEQHAHLTSVLRREREQALSTLRHHGITMERAAETETASVLEVEELQQQNNNLRQVRDLNNFRH